MNPFLDIGCELVRARRTAGMSQRELGETLGVRQQQVARWESTSYRTASLERVAAAAEAVGLERGRPLPPLVAAEAASTYGPVATMTAPVRDLGDIAARLRAHGAVLAGQGLSKIGVFGSFAFGEQTPDSDVDLLVEFADRPLGLAYMRAPLIAEAILGRKVDWAEPHLLRDRLRDRVLQEAVYVWQA